MRRILQQTTILLWKHFILRRRHFFLTLLDIGLPVLVFYGYLWFKVGDSVFEQQNGPGYAKMESDKEIYGSSRDIGTIYYAPKTDFTSMMFEKIRPKLKNLKHTISFNDEKELLRNFTSDRAEFAVVFKKIHGNKQPVHLDYVIVLSSAYIAENLDLLFAPSRYDAPEAYFNEGFIALQLALDTSYIEIVSSKNLPVNIYMQEFPSIEEDRDKWEVNSGCGLPITYGFLVTIFTLWSNIGEEKSIGIKELMKMMGLKSWMLWLGWFLHAFILNIISVGIIAHMLNEYSVLERCSKSLLVVFLLLYCAAAITFCFAISTFFYRPRVLILFGFLIWALSYHAPDKYMPDPETLMDYPYIKWSTKILYALFPNTALYYGFHTTAIYETRGVEISFKNMFESADGSDNDVTMGNVILMFLFDIIFYMLITFYVGSIYPGPYGIGSPYSFPISYVVKLISKTNNRVQAEAESATNAHPYSKIEPAPNLKPGIQIRGLYKRYGKATVVDDFSIDIYEQIITVLLGHNGAGKTTLLSVITGMCTATSGKVFINGMDITKNSDKVRETMGFCTQHNLNIPDLTLHEHLRFFAMLRGVSFRQANLEANELLRSMNVYEKRNAFASQLSGGMQRRLSLGIALVGNPKVIILDEPTSGLDPELRREIWDFLIAMRGSRTIIITTHYMEEAEVLGDRVAIMDHGNLICHGTPMFLKREYGAGYHLTITGFNNAQNVTTTVQGKINGAVLHSSSGKTLEYLLPHEMKSQFSKLLEDLEGKKSSLGITSISISVTTLEEVFLSVGHYEFKKSEQENASNSFFTENMPPNSTGLKLLGLQCWGLLMKRLLVMIKEWPMFLIMMTLLLLITFVELRLSSGSTSIKKNTGSFVYDLNQYGRTGVFYEINGSVSQLSKMKDRYLEDVKQQKGNPIMANSVLDALIRKAKENQVYYSYLLIVAVQFNISINNVNAMYSNRAYHGAAISLNLLMNAVLKGIMDKTYSIRVESLSLSAGGSTSHGGIAWMLLFPFGLILLSTIFLAFPHMERISSVKQLQFMCGVSPITYWSTMYLFDFAVYFISIATVIMFILACGMFEHSLFVGNQQLGALFIICLGYGLSIIPVMYVYSYAKSTGGAFARILISAVASFLIAIIIMNKMQQKAPITEYHPILSYYPPYCIVYILKAYNIKSRVVASYCNTDRQMANAEEKARMCNGIAVYFKDPGSIEESFRSLIYSSVVYFVFILLLELTILPKAWTIFIEFFYKKLNLYDDRNDMERKEDIKAETERISGVIERSGRNEETTARDLFLAHKIEKAYGTQKVVKGVSFAVKPGDCFGLLGVNGAGKTTVFRILTGDLPLTTGEARILTSTNDKIYLSKQRKKFLKNVGYCPQYDALNELLTGRQMLKVFALLRGLSRDTNDVVEKCIRELGLKEFADKRCGNYSGGNKRKLNVAISLIGRPELVMFDEPTSGVDPMSRRKLWDVLNELHQQDAKLGFILTSHSMDECEVLCTRLAIMKAGQLECCGTIPYLKTQFGQGFTIILKVNPSLSVTVNTSLKDDKETTSETTSTRDTGDETINEEDHPEVKKVMLEFEQKYKGFCELKDKHPGMLHYHISDTTKKWSQVFSEIDALQKKHPVIEDYNISETTLEEIFLQIARKH